MLKKSISGIMLVFVILSCVLLSANAAASTKKITDYNNGDVIEYGTYPQTSITDSTLKAALTKLAGSVSEWNSYGYYTGTGKPDGKMAPSDYMRYKDVTYNGLKYRGVFYTEYKPPATFLALPLNPEDGSFTSTQHQLCFTPNKIYWSRFDAVRWIVLNKDKGLVISEEVLDAQPLNNTLYISDQNRSSSDTKAYSDSSEKYYADNYARSSLRKWLNGTFYNTVFNTSCKGAIKATYLVNDAKDMVTDSKTGITTLYDSPEFYSQATTDNIFLISLDEVKMYSGMSESVSPTYYALVQSVQSTFLRSDKTYFLTRTACKSNQVYTNRNTTDYCYSPYSAVRPAFCFDTKKAIPVASQSVSLNKTSVTVDKGKTVKLVATMTPSNTNDKITWKSSNSKIAAVSSSGTVTAKAKGTVKITAKTTNLKTAVCTVTVKEYPVTSIALLKTKLTVKPGSKYTLTANIKPSDTTDVITWSSSNKSVATVSSKGVITVKKNGTAKITVKAESGKKSVCTVTVKTVPAKSVKLSKSSLTITAGNKYTLKATMSPSDSTDGITWSSSNKSVATVSSAGVVIAKAKGTVKITAKATSGKAAVCTVTVKPKPVHATSVKLSKTKLTLTAGKKYTLKVTMSPSNTTDKITWSSSNKSVATVSSAGVVTAKAKGTVKITAKATGGKSSVCTITVKPKPVPSTSVKLNKTKITLTTGKTYKLTATLSPSNSTDSIKWSSSNDSVATVSGGTVKAIARGTAKITAKSSSGMTDVCTVTVTKPREAFVWGKDNWNFTNAAYDGSFSSGTYRSQISTEYLNKLSANLTNTERQSVFEGDWNTSAWLDKSYNGACYGMSSTTMLAKEGYLPFEKYTTGATKLYELSKPTSNSLVSSLIIYYQMLQIKSVIQQQYMSVPQKSNKENISNIISLLRSNNTVLVCYKQENFGAHAVLAYAYEYGSFTFDGVTYDGCINICDPNSAKKYNASCNIYFNTNSYSWYIPAYNKLGTAYGAKFIYVGSDVGKINSGGYLSGVVSAAIQNYIARINAYEISSNRTITKVSESNGTYDSMSCAPGDIIEDYSYNVNGDGKGTAGYNLYDAKSAYRVVNQDNAQKISLSINYEKCSMSASSAAGKSVVFDNKGYVEVNGEAADYTLSMVLDSDYPTQWYAVTVSGKNSNKATIKKAKTGYVLSADKGVNCTVKVNNAKVKISTAVSTSYKSVLITQTDTSALVIKIDKDKNGTYETVLKSVN